MIKLYKDIREISGPLLEIGNIEGVFYEELVEVEMQDGTRRQGQVIQIRDDVALIEVYEGTDGIMPKNSGVRFMGKPFTLDVSPDIVGRVFDGLGRPKDGEAPIIAEKSIDVNGLVINPIARDYPNEFIQTGISAIDHLNTLVRGQKLPIFSTAGLPHQQLSAQIARQAKVLNSDDRFAVVFAAMGITFEGADFYINEFKDSGALEYSVLFLNLANDPVMERIATPKMALTAAEYLAFELDMHVLVIMNDMSKYCEALREISSARREVPGRRGYPGYLYTNLASLYERAGRIKGRKGSVTQIPIVTMPEGDITHPIPDLTGYITEGQILLSKELLSKGINPPIDVLTSLSRLKDNGIGAGKTREDHANTMNQVFAAYAKGKAAKELSIVLGESSLTNLDRIYAQLADTFEQKYLNQGFQEDRTIDQTLDIAWEVLSLLPEGELKRIKKEHIEKYWRKEQAEQ